ncbi:protein takeout [Schistocerca nitens]|uniref:protein takeout n=1 Tax=Schistocerca nitens TaxID=7011 RepID=UPI0021179F49|nr:protein takeout [Schistocerca nitens]
MDAASSSRRQPRAAAFLLLTACFFGFSWAAQRQYRIPYFLEQCSKSDPEVNKCLTRSANFLAANFRKGIPELGITEVEPIEIDEISIALGSGPDGYRASFRDIEAYGVSNLTVIGVRSDVDSLQFQLSFVVPRISARARYRSSGVLIMVQASGGGDYWGEYEGVKAKVYFRARPQEVQGHEYLTVEDLKMDFAVRSISMGVENLHNGNTVLQAALNLFINSNAQELLTEMKPDLKRKLVLIMRAFLEKLFSRIPYGMWLTD